MICVPRFFFEGDTAGSLKIQLDAIPLVDALFCEVNPIPVKNGAEAAGKRRRVLRMPFV